MNLLWEPFTYQFFVRGFVAALVVGTLCGLVSVYIVLRKMSYIGHGLSHSIFGGAVVTFIAGLNFYIGAGLWGVISALIITALTVKRRVSSDAAIGIITTASFALGVALISRATHYTKNLEAALFGNILGIQNEDVVSLVVVFFLVVGLIFLFYRKLLFVSFDPEVAPVYGVNVRLMETLLSITLALTIVVSLQITGVTLIAALLVLPAATARLVSHDFSRLILLSPVLGCVSSIAGMYVSYFINIPSGASIVLSSTMLFFIVYLYSDRESLSDVHL